MLAYHFDFRYNLFWTGKMDTPLQPTPSPSPTAHQGPLPIALGAGECPPGHFVSDPRHLEAKRLFEAAFAALGVEWHDAYAELVGRGWKWRRAAVVAWLAMPKRLRVPATRAALADAMVCSVATIRKIENSPDVQATLLAMSRATLLGALPAVDEALADAATDSHYKNAADRRTFYQRLGLLVETHAVMVGDKPEQVMSDDELLRRARLDDDDGDEGPGVELPVDDE